MTRLMPELAEDTPVNMDEVALLFGTHDREEGARILTSECGGCDVRIRSRIDGETGEEVFHLGDIEQVVNWRKQGSSKQTPARSSAPAPPPVQLSDDDALSAILLSDQGGKGGGAPAYSVAQVAERCGLEEGELQRRLVLGGARLEVVEGRMLAGKADVQRLISSGAIPDPAKREDGSKPRTPDPDPLSPTVDPAVEARTAGVAEAMGIELEAKPESPEESEPVTADATTQRASAQPRSRTRIGAPRRWGQR